MQIETIEMTPLRERRPFVRFYPEGGCSLKAWGCRCSPDPYLTISTGDVVVAITLSRAEAAAIQRGNINLYLEPNGTTTVESAAQNEAHEAALIAATKAAEVRRQEAILAEEEEEEEEEEDQKPCQGCDGRGWLVVAVDGDQNKLRVERCDMCLRYDSDEDAVAAMRAAVQAGDEDADRAVGCVQTPDGTELYCCLGCGSFFTEPHVHACYVCYKRGVGDNYCTTCWPDHIATHPGYGD